MDPKTRPLRIGVVGARRRAQGIGEHVARHLAALGARVTAIVGTRADTLSEAQRNLRARYGLETAGYLSLSRMLASEALDAVAICSPDATHRLHLETALAHQVHVLCDKPLVFDEGRDALADARPLVEGFVAAGKLLMVNEQWPYTLSAFDAAHPGVGVFERTAQRLEMLLCPGCAGPAMVPAALPHVLSLLLALAPCGGELRELHVVPCGEEARGSRALDVRFDYAHRRGVTAVRAMLRQVARQPRPAGYAIDGRAVWRCIEPADYSMALLPVASLEEQTDELPTPRAIGAAVPLADPLVALLREFLRRIDSGERPRYPDPIVLDGVRLLSAVYDAASAGAGTVAAA